MASDSSTYIFFVPIKMLHHIRVLPFCIGLVLGIIGVLCMDQEKTVVRRYPHPDTADQTIYRDKNGTCYRYHPKQVDCDKNESKLKDFPLSK